MVRLVFFLEPFTVLGVALSEPTVVIVPLNFLDVRPTLTLEYTAYELLERTIIFQNFLDRLAVLIRPDGEEGQSLHIGFLGKHVAAQVLPWNVWVTCGFLMGPKHTKSRAPIDRRIDDAVPVKRKVLGQFQNNFSPKLKSLISGDYQIWPMDMDPRLYETLTHRSGPGLGDEAPGGGFQGFMNYGTKLKKVFIGQFVLGLVVEVHEKLEPFSLLFDNVQFHA
jgi:hypothetical protein